MLKIASFFAGVGGIDLGFQLAEGFETVFANEIDKNAATIYRANFPDVNLIVDDIKNIHGKDIPDCDIVCGGFPCQTFSVAGKREGFEDERGLLFFEAARILDEMRAENRQPQCVFFENVKGLVTHDNGKTLKDILDRLASLGYTSTYKVLPAHCYGNLPQSRERIYIVGFLDMQKYRAFSFPDKVPLTNKVSYFVYWNLGVEKKYYYTKDSVYWDTVKNFRVETIHWFFKKKVGANITGLCPCLRAHMGNGLLGEVPSFRNRQGKIRVLVPRECYNLMGFPRSFVLPDIKDRHLYRGAGNSVAVPVVYRIADRIKKCFFLGSIFSY